jgi:hypothetical protein
MKQSLTAVWRFSISDSFSPRVGIAMMISVSFSMSMNMADVSF